MRMKSNLTMIVVVLFISISLGAQPHAYVATFDDTVTVINTSTNTVVTTIPGVTGLSVAAHPDGSRVYITAADAVAVVSTVTNTIIDSVSLNGSPSRLVVSPNGARLYAISFPGTVWVIDTQTDSVLDSFKATGSAHRGIEIHPMNRALYISNQNEGTVSVISTSSNTEVASVDVGIWPFNMAAHPNGATLYVANYFDGTISVVDTVSNSELTTISAGGFPFALTLHPDGRKLYVTDEFNAEVLVIDTLTNSVSDTISVGSLPQGIDVRSDGKSIYVANAFDDNVSVIDTATNSVVTTITTDPGPFSVGKFISPPANIFADGFESGETSFWSSTVMGAQIDANVKP